MNKPDWNNAPSWAKWLSQDEDASWWWHQYKPKWHKDYGWWQGRGRQEEVVEVPIEYPNAAKTLESRNQRRERATGVVDVSDTPWYENIPESGVLCYVNDNNEDCIPSHHSSFTRRVFKYSGTGFKAVSPYYATMTEWKYAIPVDHNLRLPDGRIF